ncbi:MAG: CPBP family glutamic-type intramembrane protease [Terracidiphilus sp.]
MSTFPEPLPHEPEDSPAVEDVAPPSTDPLAPENTPAPPAEWTGEPEDPNLQPEEAAPTSFFAAPPAEEVPREPFFTAYAKQPVPRDERIPNMGHLALLALLALFGLIGTMMLVPLALHFHLFGITSISQAATDYRYALGSQAAQYIITFAGCIVVFPIIWRKPFFDGIHWHGATALQRTGRLISAAVFCFFVAMIDGVLMPGPTNAPIDELFHAPGAAWVLFAFGVTLAPFFEEMAFRGFVLPALCTAYDWCVEHFNGAPRRPLDENQNPQWSLSAMIFASLVTSVPFALMHGAQTGWSLGPFLLLIFVSLVLCSVRLYTRSLAASTMVHACYNFMLFSFMLLGTGGFKHLDKM